MVERNSHSAHHTTSNISAIIAWCVAILFAALLSTDLFWLRSNFSEQTYSECNKRIKNSYSEYDFARTKAKTSPSDQFNSLVEMNKRQDELCLQIMSVEAARSSANWTGTGAILAGIAALAAGFAALYAWRQANAATDALTKHYPPRVLVKNVAIWEKLKDRNTQIDLAPDLEIEGELWIVNLGGEQVTIGTDVAFMTWCSAEPLPMIPPYVDDDRKNRKHTISFKVYPDFTRDATTMNPGEVAKANFTTKLPSNFCTKMTFYVLGAIVYTDRLGTRRPTLFARRYDPCQRRFVPELNNPDYEGFE